MRTGVSLGVRLVRLSGVIFSMSIAIASLVLLPFALISAVWTAIYSFFSGRVPGVTLSIPGDLKLFNGVDSFYVGGYLIPLPPSTSSVIETSLLFIGFLMAGLLVIHSVISMKKRIWNASGFRASRLPSDHFANTVVSSLRDESKGPRSAVWVIPVDGVKAFALSGPVFGHAIVISQGIISTLPKDMIAWIIAHEYGHIRHGDTRGSSFWILAMRSVYLLDRTRIFLMNILLNLVRIMPILRAFTLPVFFLFRILVLISRFSIYVGKMVFLVFDRWASRKMEFAADEYAALTIGPDIGASLFEGMTGDIEPLFNGIFATHPPLSLRAVRLREMSKEEPPVKGVSQS